MAPQREPGTELLLSLGLEPEHAPQWGRWRAEVWEKEWEKAWAREKAKEWVHRRGEVVLCQLL